ncbi:MAG: Membrane-fusion protein [Candidatus Moranbacteria bacterium GW2011_GWE1_36_7]|nr:MAG: Membrane-fusion protein [Candidatus Moranbacteria bacterium GW2011_GWD2_36_12]KKQ04865.1 MAG: Membrane-fusion protein [Candidatus Moranbacteria bacterium GW2011_GWE2_36_40]KKQ13672.1 MAG: Membrane-fusion protein [Candidatus Moranbacteria bacterium GW2011_GWE1_36_7]
MQTQKTPTKQHFMIMSVIIMITLTIFLWPKMRSNANKNTPTAQAVKTIQAKEADKNFPLEISGFVRGENRADIAPMTSGRILRIFKNEGDSVKKGEVLATIETIQSDAQVSAAQTSVDALQKTLIDSKKYYNQLVDQTKDNSGSSDEEIKSAKRARDLQIQAAKNQLISAQGALDIARASKDNSIITAPFSGTIISINGREGGFANFSMPIMSISTKNSKEIETYVSATNARNIAVGTIATMYAPSGQPISGSVTTVSTGSDSQSLKTLIRIHLDDSSDTIYLGDFLRGEILIPNLQQKAVSVPRNAVISRGGDQIVFVVDENNIATEKSIETSSEHNGMINIINGIAVDEKIVIEGQQYLINGSTTKSYESN